jgi:hypothetical protein
MIRLREVAGIEQRLAHVLGVVVPDGVRENRQQVINATLSWLARVTAP